MAITLDELKQQSEAAGINLKSIPTQDIDEAWKLIIENDLFIVDSEGDKVSGLKEALDRSKQINGKHFFVYFVENNLKINGKSAWEVAFENNFNITDFVWQQSFKIKATEAWYNSLAVLNILYPDSYKELVKSGKITNEIQQRVKERYEEQKDLYEYNKIKLAGKEKKVDDSIFKNILEIFGTNLEISKRAELLNIKDEKGYTAVHYAAVKGDFANIDSIREIRGDNFKKFLNEHKDTIIHAAVAGKNVDIYKTIIHEITDKKTALQARNKEGKTPLHIAVENGDVKLVRAILTTEGIDKHKLMNSKDSAGKTPMDMAKDKVVLRVLKDHKEQNKLADAAMKIVKTKGAAENTHVKDFADKYHSSAWMQFSDWVFGSKKAVMQTIPESVNKSFIEYKENSREQHQKIAGEVETWWLEDRAKIVDKGTTAEVEMHNVLGKILEKFYPDDQERRYVVLKELDQNRRREVVSQIQKALDNPTDKEKCIKEAIKIAVKEVRKIDKLQTADSLLRKAEISK